MTALLQAWEGRPGEWAVLGGWQGCGRSMWKLTRQLSVLFLSLSLCTLLLSCPSTEEHITSVIEKPQSCPVWLEPKGCWQGLGHQTRLAVCTVLTLRLGSWPSLGWDKGKTWFFSLVGFLAVLRLFTYSAVSLRYTR